MTGVNHALTGAVIGLQLSNPILVVPLAFISHFVLDALPHFGQKFENRTSLFKKVIIIDIFLITALFAYLISISAWVATLGALSAFALDFVWIYRFTFKESFGRLPTAPLNRFNQLHVNIQKFESVKGIYFDLFWLLFMSYLLFKLL